MSRLHIYTVHVNPALTEPYEKAEFVEEGFNWKAFVFTGLWALYNRLWFAGTVLIVFNVAMLHSLTSEVFTPTGLSILDLGIRVLIGFYANDWVRAKLKRKGYITADIVSGDSLLRGQQRFFDRYFAAYPTLSPAV